MIDRAAGLALGFALDRWLGDPSRFHPVAGFGSCAAALERRLYADSVWRGASYSALLVGSAVAVGVLADRRGRLLVTAAATWAVLGGRSLEREAQTIGGLLESSDLAGARQRLTHLVGRDTSDLSEREIARAVVESVAENSSDAVVAPLFWGALAGVPGLIGYRAINTLDAMAGHRNARYEHFGKPSARLDDLANLAPARISALLTAALSGRPRAALRAWVRDGSAHPSPNAGPVESAFAGALGLRLGGTNRYGTRTERRGVMGEGRAPLGADIARAADLSRAVGRGAVVASCAFAVVRALRADRTYRRRDSG